MKRARKPFLAPGPLKPYLTNMTLSLMQVAMANTAFKQAPSTRSLRSLSEGHVAQLLLDVIGVERVCLVQEHVTSETERHR